MRKHRNLILVTCGGWLLTIACVCGGRETNPPEAPPAGPPAAVLAAEAAAHRFELGPGFTPDPQQVTGLAGGPRRARDISNDCRGYIAAAANHILSLSAPVNDLHISVYSEEDTTLVVQLANGQYYCDDDGGPGNNPMLSGAFPAGVHRVYVGTYSAPSGPGQTYTFTVTTVEVANAMDALAEAAETEEREAAAEAREAEREAELAASDATLPSTETCRRFNRSPVERERRQYAEWMGESTAGYIRCMDEAGLHGGDAIRESPARRRCSAESDLALRRLCGRALR